MAAPDATPQFIQIELRGGRSVKNVQIILDDRRDFVLPLADPLLMAAIEVVTKALRSYGDLPNVHRGRLPVVERRRARVAKPQPSTRHYGKPPALEHDQGGTTPHDTPAV